MTHSFSSAYSSAFDVNQYNHGGYWSLIAIYEQAIEEAEMYAEELPTKCPNDNTTLLTGPNGELFCKFDGWQYFM